MDLQKLLFTADGRLNRQPYWLVGIGLGVCSLVVQGVAHLLGADILGMLVAVLVMVPSVMLGIKRCHDRDRSGWFLLVLLVPVVALWPVVELLFLPGTPGPNRFGPDPLAPRLAYAA